MKRKTRILLFIGILAFCFRLASQARCDGGFREEIYVYTDYVTSYYFSGSELRSRPMLGVNLDFYFNMTTIPVNVSLPAFDPTLFNYAKYTAFAFSRVNYSVSLECVFSKGANETIANMAAQEFGLVFNHTSTPIPDPSGPLIDNSTAVYRYDFGNIPYTLESMRSLFKYCDNQTCFSGLVDKFLGAIPQEEKSWTPHWYYTLSRTDSGYCWELWIVSDRNYNFSVGGLYAMSLNQMLNNTGGSLVPCESGSVIVLKVHPNDTADPRQICLQEVYSLSPLSNYSYKVDGNSEYMWVLKQGDRLSDVVFTLNLTVTSVELPQNALPEMMVLLAVPVVGLGVGFVLVLGWRKVRNRSGFELAGVMGTSSGVVYLAGGMFAFAYCRVIERFGYTRTEYPYLQYSGILLGAGVALLVLGVAFLWRARHQPTGSPTA